MRVSGFTSLCVMFRVRDLESRVDPLTGVGAVKLTVGDVVSSVWGGGGMVVDT